MTDEEDDLAVLTPRGRDLYLREKAKVPALNLVDFLLARIAEDEHLVIHAGDDGMSLERWLAECEAKRLIVEKFKRYEDLDVSEAEADALYGVLRLLAEPYADHPDYDAEWRP